MAKDFVAIATLNTYGNIFFSKLKTRYQIISQELNREDIDFINFQEVFTYLSLNILRSGLTNFSFCSYEPSFLGPMGGLVTFSKKPFSKVTYLKLNLPIKSLRSLIGKILRGDKGALAAETEGMVVINVHLNSYPSSWQSLRPLDRLSKRQLDRLVNLIQSFTSYPLMIVSGDFNIAKESVRYSYFMNCSRLFDLFAKDSSPTFQQKFLGGRRKSHRIDYIFLSRKARFVSQKLRLFKFPRKINQDQQLYLSDHIGLLAKFTGRNDGK